MKSQDKQRYPIGRFEYGKSYTLDETRRNIRAIAQLPKELKKALKKLKSGQLDVPYRKGGWTPRQVVHHLADSHMNAYIRMKLAVTEQAPIIKPYEESDWAETEDSRSAPVKMSLKLLAPLHRRWVMFLESLSDEALERGYFHPEMQRIIPLPEAIALYAWHGRHHVAHIRLLAKGKARGEERPTLEPAIVSAAPTRRPRGRRAAAEPVAAAERRKPGPKPRTVSAEAGAAPTRKRRTKAEMEAFRAQQAAEKAAGVRKKPGPKPAETTQNAGAETGAKRRSMSLEHKAKIRAAHLARRAAATAQAPLTTPVQPDGKRRHRTKAEMEASRAQAVATEPAGRRKPGPKPKTAVATATEPAGRRKPGPKPKTTASTGGETTSKRRIGNAEGLKKAREVRAAKRAAAIAAGELPAPKPKKQPDGTPGTRGRKK